MPVALGSAILLAGRVLAAEPDAAAQPPPKPRMINMLSAVYGGKYEQPCDAFQFVQSECDHRFRCTVAVGDSLCPSAGATVSMFATLRVTYRCSESERVPHTGAADKPFLLRISCARARP